MRGRRIAAAAAAAVIRYSNAWLTPFSIGAPRHALHSATRSAFRHPIANRARLNDKPLRRWRPAMMAETDSAAPAAAEESPYPSVGDVVTYEGKWADDISLAEVRNLQYIESRGKWIADLLPLEEIGDGQYAREKGRRTVAEDVDTLRPVRAFFVRSTDAFKVMQKEGTGAPSYIADGYRVDNFELPKRTVDVIKLQESLEEYEALKTRFLRDTLLFGAAGTAIATAVGGLDRGLVFGLGAATSAAYVCLLEKNADHLGTRRGGGLSPLDVLRLSLPLLLVGGLALANYIADPAAARFLRLVPRDQFAAAMLGFVGSYRVPLLYRELSGAVRGDELAAMLPGSIGKGTQLWRGSRSGGGAAAAGTDGGVTRDGGAAAALPVLVISGPQGIGRAALVERILTEEPRLRRPLLWTSRPRRRGEKDGAVYRFVEPVKMEEMTRDGSFLHVFAGAGAGGTDAGTAGGSGGGEAYGLRAEDLLAPATEEGRVCVLDADCGLVAKLVTIDGAALVGVWVSLGNLRAFEDRLREGILAGGGGGCGGDEAVEAEVRSQVKQVIEDIEFGVTSGIFEFTILGTDEEANMSKLRKAASYALAGLPAAR
ncbi:unnamed protein product [Phaeothamnion confervicola]